MTRINNERLENLCNRKGFTFDQLEGYVHIKSGMDHWRIVCNSNGLMLYHRNTNGKGYKGCGMEDYHLQKECGEKSLKGIIEYIDRHDKAKISRYSKRPSSIWTM